MTDKSILVLVVSRSGPLQNGLLALTTSIPLISAVLVAEDINSALRMIKNHQPALIILDMSLLKVQEVIQQIKELSPSVYLIYIADDIKQQREAEESGIDSVLIKGFSAQKLITIVENIIDCREDTALIQANTEGGANKDLGNGFASES